MFKRIYYSLLLLAIVATADGGRRDLFMVDPDSVATLVTTYCSARPERGDTAISFFFNFDRKHPMMYFELVPKEKKLIFTFQNTKLGGFAQEDSIKEFRKGPIQTLYLKDELKDRNEGIRGLSPELYYVTTAVLICDPMVKDAHTLGITEKDESISAIFPWPTDTTKRNALYGTIHEKKWSRKHTVLTITGVGVAGLAGGGLLLWNHLSNNREDSDILQPNLPVHPAYK